jgi:hypothetical protein
MQVQSPSRLHSGTTLSLPHYHLRQGGGCASKALCSAESTSERATITLPPAIDHGNSLKVATGDLAPSAAAFVPARRSKRVSQVNLPAARNCVRSTRHDIQTPKRSLDDTPQIIASSEAPSQLRRQDLSDPVASVSTEVSLPTSSGSGGAEVDNLPRKIATNRPPPHLCRRLSARSASRVILEVASTPGTVRVTPRRGIQRS